MGREGSESPTDRRGSSLRRPAENHDTEVIFVLPSLQMHLKTEHMQGEDEPADGGNTTVYFIKTLMQIKFTCYPKLTTVELML